MTFIVISGPLPAKLPIKNYPKNFLLHQTTRLEISGGSPWGQFLKTMTEPEDMDEIDLFGTKVPDKSATVNSLMRISCRKQLNFLILVKRDRWLRIKLATYFYRNFSVYDKYQTNCRMNHLLSRQKS